MRLRRSYMGESALIYLEGDLCVFDGAAGNELDGFVTAVNRDASAADGDISPGGVFLVGALDAVTPGSDGDLSDGGLAFIDLYAVFSFDPVAF